jgi:hypothetical protein
MERPCIKVPTIAAIQNGIPTPSNANATCGGVVGLSVFIKSPAQVRSILFSRIINVKKKPTHAIK